MVRGNRCYGLHTVIIKGQQLLVHQEGLLGVVKPLMDAGYSCDHTRLITVLLLALLEYLNGSLRLVILDRYLTQFNLSRNHLLALERGDELPLCLLDHAHLELALSNTGLPPPVFAPDNLSRLRRHIECPPKVGLNIDEVLNYCLCHVAFLGEYLGIQLVSLDELVALLDHRGSTKTQQPAT